MEHRKVLHCVSTYVRNVLASDDLRPSLHDSLQRGVPFTRPGFASIAMIDISGYSSLTSNLSTLGKLSSEVITNTVGAYMAQVVDTIDGFGGDVIKFLGDAILVSFPQRDSETESETTERATACCLYISVNYSTIKLDLDQVIQENSRLLEDLSYQTMGRPKLDMRDSVTSPAKSVMYLTIHVGVTAGQVSHAIIGVPNKRMDYCVHGECVNSLGEALDGAKSGELGLTRQALAQLSPSMLAKLQSASAQGPSEKYAVIPKDKIVSMCDEFMQKVQISPPQRRTVSKRKSNASTSSSLLVGVPGETLLSDLTRMDTSRRNSATSANSLPVSDEAYEMAQYFINESLYHKLSITNWESSPTRSLVVGDRRNTITRQPTQVKSTKEFRTVTVIFVKLKSEFQVGVAQKAMEGLVEVLKRWEGVNISVFQQFSVDDKGQTMLACFGLPPWAHERDPLHALKAAVEFTESAVAKKEIGKFTIGVATGPLLFSTIGSEERSDASLLGDVVNVAARLLNVETPDNKSSVKCDLATYLATKEDFNHVSLGTHKVKGKVEPIEVWCVQNKENAGAGTQASAGASGGMVTFGYVKERKALTEGLNDWMDGGVGKKIVIEGKSGLGKSKLLDYLAQEATEMGVPFCLTQGSEIKQYTAYASITQLVNYVVNRHVDLNQEQEENGDNSSGVAGAVRKPIVRKPSDATSFASGSLFASGNVMDKRRQSLMSLGRRHDGRSMTAASRSQLSQFGLASDNELDQQLQIQHRNLVKFLKMMGESSSMAPLLGELLPFAKVDETKETKQMDPQTRMALLKSMIVRIVAKSVEMEKMLIIFDDTQWLDPISQEIIYTIIRNCPHIMIVLFTRPFADLPVKTITKIVDSPEVDHIALKGLSKDDIEDILRHKLSQYEFKGIGDNLLTAILEKTGGVPLVIDTLVESLRSQLLEFCYIDVYGSLQITGIGGEEKLASLSTVSTATMRQFDLLNHYLQDILRKAAILGQYFSLLDLIFFLDDDLAIEEVEDIIKEYDTYQFLIKSETEATESYSYYFRHIQIMQAIYDSLAYAERSATHLSAAEYFESALTDSTRGFLLPLVAYHYQKTSQYEKQAVYLEELGNLNFENEHMPEAANCLEPLLALVNDHPELAPSNERKAFWSGQLAIAKVNLTFYTKKEYDLCAETLRLSGRNWPHTEKEAKKELFRSAIALFQAWRKTKGGTKAAKKYDTTSEKAKVAAKASLMAYRALFRLGMYSTLILKEQRALILFAQCTVAILYGYCNKIQWAGLLYMTSFGLSWSVVPVSEIMLKQAMKVEMSIPKDEVGPLYAYYHFKAFRFMHKAKLADCKSTFEIFSKTSEQRGDHTNYLLSLHNMQTVLLQQGDRISLSELCIEQSAKERDTYEFGSYKGVVSRALLVEDYDYAWGTYQHILKILSYYPTSIYHYITLGFCRIAFALRKEDYSEVLEAMNKYSESASRLNLHFTTAVDDMITFPVISWMLIDPVSPVGKGNIYKWTEEERKTLLKYLDDCLVGYNFFAKKVKWELVKWAQIMMEACRMAVNNEKSKATKLILKSLKTKALASILDEMVVAKAMAYAFLGLYLENQADRRHYYDSALQMLTKFGFTYIVKCLTVTDLCLRGSVR
ncbi:hypothetical protein HDV05_004994 [Chytridiales sp. JEL 0842]|nr:hypothetical protein HDV05_004994 [Chytridiales sp. JEL 0842]